MPQDTFYPQILNLDQYDIFLEEKLDNSRYIFIDELPSVLSYGKHYFLLSWKENTASPYQVKHGSKILFELKDDDGHVIFSDLANTLPVNGAAVGYVWVKKNPKRLPGDRWEITDGPCVLSVVYELEGGNIYHNELRYGRSTFQYEVKKKIPNKSPILFYSGSQLSGGLSISESLDFDSDDQSPYKRSYLHISNSHMKTDGGKVEFVELSYIETGSVAFGYAFKLLTAYKLSGSGEYYEVTSSDADGLNPLSHIHKVVTPREIRRDKNVIFRLRYLNSNEEVAKDISENTDVSLTYPMYLSGSPFILETTDNLIHSSGSLKFGNSLIENIEVKYGKFGGNAMLELKDGVITASSIRGKFFREGTELVPANVSGSHLTEVGSDVTRNSKIQINSTNAPPEALTVTGNISASQDLFVRKGSFGTLNQSEQLAVEGNISASGHLYTPKIRSSGSDNTLEISASNIYMTGSVGIGNPTPTKTLTVSGTISASGDISASGGGFFGDDIYMTNNTNIYSLTTAGQAASMLYFNTKDELRIGHTSTTKAINFRQMWGGIAMTITGSFPTEPLIGINTQIPSKTLTVAGDISASGGLTVEGDITSSRFITGTHLASSTFNGAIVTGHISASGDIIAGDYHTGGSFRASKYSSARPNGYFEAGHDDTDEGVGIMLRPRNSAGALENNVFISSSGYVLIGQSITDGTSVPKPLTVDGHISASGLSVQVGGGWNTTVLNATSESGGVRVKIGSSDDSGKVLTVYGDISASNTIYADTGSLGYILLDRDNIPTSDPGVKGAVYASTSGPSSGILKISAG